MKNLKKSIKEALEKVLQEQGIILAEDLNGLEVFHNKHYYDFRVIDRDLFFGGIFFCGEVDEIMCLINMGAAGRDEAVTHIVNGLLFAINEAKILAEELTV